MNYVFISPHFPSNYKNFAIALKAVCAKPDNGVGAANTYKIRSHDELESFSYRSPTHSIKWRNSSRASYIPMMGW